MYSVRQKVHQPDNAAPLHVGGSVLYNSGNALRLRCARDPTDLVLLQGEAFPSPVSFYLSPGNQLAPFNWSLHPPPPPFYDFPCIATPVEHGTVTLATRQ
jgi:hypothetical protein